MFTITRKPKGFLVISKYRLYMEVEEDMPAHTCGNLKTTKSWCWWCKGKCGVIVYTEKERLIKVELDPKAPAGSFGAGCNKLRL